MRISDWCSDVCSSDRARTFSGKSRSRRYRRARFFYGMKQQFAITAPELHNDIVTGFHIANLRISGQRFRPQIEADRLQAIIKLFVQLVERLPEDAKIGRAHV